MATDIFDFWSNLPSDTKVHPADKPIFNRVSTDLKHGHGFDLRCLPLPFAGRLRTAPVVLLYLSPGLADQDQEEADSPAAQERQLTQRTGDAPLPTQADYPSAWRWWAARTKIFGELNHLRDKIAFLNIGAYHSEDFTDHPLLAALPSSRAAIDWAQSVLFSQAEAGERAVICLRSARYWGLQTGAKYDGGLFAPPVGRGGHMLNTPAREEVVTAVRAALTQHLDPTL